MIVFIRFILIVFITYWIVQRLKSLFRAPHQSSRTTHPNTKKSSQLSPYEVLGVSPDSSPSDIQKAYRKARALYHPDKVMHLGKDLQNVAAEKTSEIIWAYEQLNN